MQFAGPQTIDKRSGIANRTAARELLLIISGIITITRITLKKVPARYRYKLYDESNYMYAHATTPHARITIIAITIHYKYNEVV